MLRDRSGGSAQEAPHLTPVRRRRGALPVVARGPTLQVLGVRIGAMFERRLDGVGEPGFGGALQGGGALASAAIIDLRAI